MTDKDKKTIAETNLMAMYYIKKKKEKKEAETKVKKPRKVNWVARADKAFSLYIRLRDSQEYDFKYFKCPTCGRVLPFAKADCSHLWSRTHMGTRYDEENCHIECSSCNRMKSDHLLYFSEYVRKKIGDQRFELLKVKAHTICKRSAFEMEQIVNYYKEKTKQLQDGIYKNQ